MEISPWDNWLLWPSICKKNLPEMLYTIERLYPQRIGSKTWRWWIVYILVVSKTFCSCINTLFKNWFLLLQERKNSRFFTAKRKKRQIFINYNMELNWYKVSVYFNCNILLYINQLSLACCTSLSSNKKYIWLC